MSALRLVLSVFVIVGLSAGYALSQYNYLLGPGAAVKYASDVDAATVPLAALAIAVISAILCFVPEKSRNESAP